MKYSRTWYSVQDEDSIGGIPGDEYNLVQPTSDRPFKIQRIVKFVALENFSYFFNYTQHLSLCLIIINFALSNVTKKKQIRSLKAKKFLILNYKCFYPLKTVIIRIHILMIFADVEVDVNNGNKKRPSQSVLMRGVNVIPTEMYN